jgi:hypothetical protein
VGGDDDGVLHIIMACMAQYCNYWRKRKSPLMVILLQALAGGWEAEGEEWKTLWIGWILYHNLLNNHLFIVSGWNICHEQEEAQ